MNRLKNILVPVDFSSASSLILKQGARLASWSDATLHVLHVIEPGVLKHLEGALGKQGRESLEERAKVLMKECLQNEVLRGVAVEQSIVMGHPSKCIVTRVDALKADLVVVSSHDISQKRLGRMEAQVVRHARCKVLIVRDWQAGPFRKIAACLDFCQLGREVLEQAVHVARNDEARLELIHVLYPVEHSYDVYKLDFGRKTEDEFRAETRKWLTKTIKEFTAPLQDDLDALDCTTTILESTDPAVAITAYAQRHHADLVVLGTTGQTHWSGLRLGSNAEHLVHNSHCSVLAIKSKGRPDPGAAERQGSIRVT